jgi:hypothetical protein
MPASAGSFSNIYKETTEPYNVRLLPPVPVKQGVISGTNVGGVGCGDLFLLTPGAAGKPYTRTTLYTFLIANRPVDGCSLSPNLISDKHGNIWGTTGAGGANGEGTLFELVAPTTTGGTYSFRLVMQMPASFGAPSYDQLLFGTNGSLYGLFRGPVNGAGIGAIFEVTAAQLKSGAGAPTVLYTFPATDAYAFGLVRDQKGNFYGIEPQGGNVIVSGFGGGALWEVSPPTAKGGAYTEQIIHNFCSIQNSETCVDGYDPLGGVAISSTGTLYGTSYVDGAAPSINGYPQNGNGTVWSAQPPASGSGAWKFTVLHTFYNYNADGSDARDYYVGNPLFAPVLTKAGEIVVALGSGGALDIDRSIRGGVVGVSASTGADAMIGNDFAVYVTRKGGDTPSTPVSIDSAGNFYGATQAYYAPSNCSGTCTYGVIYKVTP